MNHRYDSSANFSTMLDYMNSCQHSSSESINELDTTQEEVSKTDDKKESLFKDGEDAISWDDI